MINQPQFRIVLSWLLLLFCQVALSSNHDAVVNFHEQETDSLTILRNLSIEAARNNEVEAASYYADEYIKQSLDIGFIKNSNFRNFREDEIFKRVEAQYLPRLQWGYSIYIYAGLIGFFIVLMFNVQKKKDWVANILLSSFIFIHSFFIIHVGLHSMKYSLLMPHIYSASTIFSFLYGPLLYFYFKRIKTGYKFKKIDFLHLVPTIFLLFIFIPVYILPRAISTPYGLSL